MDIEEVKVENENEFKGNTACPGNVSGAVKIDSSVADLDKVQAGDILLALTTYVTEDGGITCHAAIVAREFKIPCVVGAKKITKILKDGDRVEVDATNGLVKKV